MHTPETIMTLVDEHAKDMLRRFGGTNVDPDKSRAAVLEALQELHFHLTLPVRGFADGGFVPSLPLGPHGTVHGELLPGEVLISEAQAQRLAELPSIEPTTLHSPLSTERPPATPPPSKRVSIFGGKKS